MLDEQIHIFGQANTASSKQGTEAPADRDVNEMSGLFPSNEAINGTNRYNGVCILLDLDDPEISLQKPCSSLQQQHQPRPLFGSSDEELALLLKYTHVAGGAALPDQDPGS